MSVDLVERIGRDLDKIAGELWNFDGPDNVINEVARKLSLMKSQIDIQKSLQATANLLRQQPNDKALPRQQATKVKHLVRFIFRKESRGGGRHKRLRDLDCNALKFFGLSYTAEEIVKMEDDTFKILLERGVEFFQRRELSRFLHRPDVDKAVDAKFEDPDDDGRYEKFIQDHTKFRLRMRKRKHDEIESSDMSANIQVTGCDEAEPGRPPANGNTNAEPVKYGDVFTLGIEDARYALSSGENVTEIFLTNPWPANQLGRKPSFLTAWLSKDLGELLSKRGRPIDY